MVDARPEPWLRGPVPEIPALLQPAAHAFLLSIEDCEHAAAGLTTDALWRSPGGAAPIGFHLRHLAGSTDRLLTYARGERLTREQMAVLGAEATPGDPPAGAPALLAGWRATVDRALAQLAVTPEASLGDSRAVGRAQLPSTVLGLLFHAAEHASRHTGQVVTLAKVVRAEPAR
jgi:DinB superfamily